MYCRGNPIIITDPTGHGWLSDLFDKANEWIESVEWLHDFLQWISAADDVYVPVYTQDIGPGGTGGGPSGSRDFESTYGGNSSNDYGSRYLRDVIVPSSPNASDPGVVFPGEALGRNKGSGITSEIRNQHTLKQLDSTTASLTSGDFVGMLDGVAGIEEKMFVLQQIPANFARPQGTGAKSDLGNKMRSLT